MWRHPEDKAADYYSIEWCNLTLASIEVIGRLEVLDIVHLHFKAAKLVTLPDINWVMLDVVGASCLSTVDVADYFIFATFI